MCVRYLLNDPEAAIAANARALAKKIAAPDVIPPRYNIAPTQSAPAIASAPGGPEVRTMRWGFAPRAGDSRKPGYLITNARAETAAALPAFRQGIARRRCLLPANGFYEWRTTGKTKLPHLFTLRDGAPFSFAGIWEPSEDELPETFVILTTAPNDLVASIHHRMPVILPPESIPRWIGAEPLSADDYRMLTKPYPADRLRMREVNRFVSNSRNEGPQCLAPPEPPEPELAL